MSIRDVEKNRRKQEQAISERRTKEAQARPDAMHRAIVFVLRQIALNNRDAAGEVRYHIEQLDREKANTEILPDVDENASVNGAAETVVATGMESEATADEPDDEPDPPAPARVNMASLPKRSRRFTSRS